jgi:hypothetical protein
MVLAEPYGLCRFGAKEVDSCADEYAHAGIAAADQPVLRG